MLQSTPELAERLAQYQRVCFVDAHTGDLEQATRLAPVAPAFTNSPFTHHLTPATCLALAQALYGRAPEAVLASVRAKRLVLRKNCRRPQPNACLNSWGKYWPGWAAALKARQHRQACAT